MKNMEEQGSSVKSLNLKLNEVTKRYGKGDNGRVCQGDILKDIEFVEFTSLTAKSGKLFKYPYLVVLSQDCDLQSDFGREEEDIKKTSEEDKSLEGNNETQDCKLHTILVCPAYDLNEFKEGKHLEGLSLNMRLFKAGEISKIKGDKYERFHYLHELVDLGIPELVIDFKHFYTIPRDIIYNQSKKSYLATINILFRENLSQRFSNYLSRIGLPTL